RIRRNGSTSATTSTLSTWIWPGTRGDRTANITGLPPFASDRARFQANVSSPPTVWRDEGLTSGRPFSATTAIRDFAFAFRTESTESESADIRVGELMPTNPA